MKTIWGAGTLEICNDTIGSMSFTQALHKLYFTKLNYRQTTIDAQMHLTSIVYRPHIECQISICTQDDIYSVINLLYYMQGGLYDNGVLTVFPQYADNYNTDFNVYNVHILNTDFMFENLANTKVGQVVNITFIGKDLVKLPINTSNIEWFYMADSTGDTYVDESGVLYIMNN